MKTTDPAERGMWSSSRNEGHPKPAKRIGRTKAIVPLDLAYPDGMDGPHELASSFGKGARGICTAGGIFGAADHERAADQEEIGFAKGFGGPGRGFNAAT